MDLETVIQSEVHQKEKNKYRITYTIGKYILYDILIRILSYRISYMIGKSRKIIQINL